MRLVTFPGIKQAKPEEARERALQRKLEDPRDDPGIEAADYNHLYKASFKPNDPRFGAQWGLKTAHFPGAWEDARGTGVKIAIVDSGIDKNHPDIGTKIAAQQTFIADKSAPYPIFDSFDHGTHVAGIAATLTNNDKGVAGGCPACKLLIAKVLNANGDTYADNLASGIDWSANNGADVINLSLAGLLASEGKTASEIRQRMQSTATDLGAAGDDPKFGYGRINAKRAVP
jgi:thermitase